jgi:hypothetical protein
LPHHWNFFVKENIFPCGIYTYIRTFDVEQEFLNLMMDVDGNGMNVIFNFNYIINSNFHQMILSLLLRVGKPIYQKSTI